MSISSIEARPQPSDRIHSTLVGLSAVTYKVTLCLMAAAAVFCLLIVILDLSIPTALSPSKPLAPDFDTFARMVWRGLSS